MRYKLTFLAEDAQALETARLLRGQGLHDAVTMVAYNQAVVDGKTRPPRCRVDVDIESSQLDETVKALTGLKHELMIVPVVPQFVAPPQVVVQTPQIMIGTTSDARGHVRRPGGLNIYQWTHVIASAGLGDKTEFPYGLNNYGTIEKFLVKLGYAPNSIYSAVRKLVSSKTLDDHEKVGGSPELCILKVLKEPQGYSVSGKVLTSQEVVEWAERKAADGSLWRGAKAVVEHS